MPRTHVIVLPGSGYRQLSPRGPDSLPWLESLGFSSSVLEYPVRTRHPAPLEAIRSAIRQRRAEGAERIGLLGYSAGGHLAAHAALTAPTPQDRVDFAILGYPVVSMLLESHRGSRENLIGLDAPASLRAETSTDLLVTADAPPFFVWHTSEDHAVPVQHSYLLGMALAAAGVRHALHVFPRGAHGLNIALGEHDGTARDWTSLCAAWLREEGFAPSG